MTKSGKESLFPGGRGWRLCEAPVSVVSQLPVNSAEATHSLPSPLAACDELSRGGEGLGVRGPHAARPLRPLAPALSRGGERELLSVCVLVLILLSLPGCAF